MSVSIRAFVAVGLALALAGCTPAANPSVESELVTTTATELHPTLLIDPGVTVIPDVQYGTADGTPLLLDVCLPPDAASDAPGASPRAAIVAIHGGSWRRGDKADLDFGPACRWLASAGFVVISVNYRLAPEWSFPAPLDDVRAAVRWLRAPEQVSRLSIDPARIGAFGASAGGNLAALLALDGTGDWGTGTRVAAVVDMSGLSDLREPIEASSLYRGDFVRAQLDYLGCAALTECAAAAEASPVTHVDASDPPFLVTHSLDEFLPVAQSDALVTALRGAGIATTYLTVEGDLHGVSILDHAMAARVVEFFRATLALVE